MLPLTASSNAVAHKPAAPISASANPAKQAKAALGAPAGADFGAMVASFARLQGANKGK